MRLLLLSLFTLPISLFAATPQELQLRTLDDQPTTLAAQLSETTTLVLIVSAEADLAPAQQLLTLAYAEKQPTLLLLQLPSNALQARALQKAANHHFRSPTFRPQIFTTTQSPYPETKTLLLSPNQPSPLYQSSTYPQSLPTP